MSIIEHSKAFIILIPVVLLLVTGFILTLSTRTMTLGRRLSVPIVLKNLSRTMLMVGVTMVGLLMLQELVGYHF